MSERVRMCGGTWRFCDGDCNHCPKAYATNTTATISKEQLDEIKPPIFTKEQLAEMLGIVKHGHWIKKINPNYSPFDPCSSEELHICNQCGYESEFGTRFCPDCGAKMDGEREQ